MDFQLSEEQTLLRDTTRDLLARSYDAESRIKAVESDLGPIEIAVACAGFDVDVPLEQYLAGPGLLHRAVAPGFAATA